MSSRNRHATHSRKILQRRAIFAGSRKNNFLKATFSLNGQILTAYYFSNGDLQAVVRNITSDQLPINLLTSLRKDYSEYWITDLFEMSSDGKTTYYVTIENSDKKIVLKSDDLSSWEIYSKEKKTGEVQ